MATKKIVSNVVRCTCSICKHEAMAFKGTQHRRCPGGPPVKREGEEETRPLPLKEKHDKLPGNARGKWE